MHRYLLIILFFAAYSSITVAVETEGLVSRIYVNSSGLVLFALDQEVKERPACANNTLWQYAFSLQSSTSGREMYSMLLAAKTMNRDIKVGYLSSNCSSLFPAASTVYVYFSH